MFDQARVDVQKKRGFFNRSLKYDPNKSQITEEPQDDQVYCFESPSYSILLQKGLVSDDLSAHSVSNNGSVMNKSCLSGMSFLGRQSISKSQFPSLSDKRLSSRDSGSINNFGAFKQFFYEERKHEQR